MLLISYCFALSISSGQQIKISLPIDGAVFQQQNGIGTIKVEGTFNSRNYSGGVRSASGSLWRVDAKTGQRTSSDPAYTIFLSRNGSVFTGSVDVPAGWYDLQIRAVLSGSLGFRAIDSRVQRVGVGEVFIIAGQSNAQGLPNTTGDLNIAYPLPSYDGVRVQANNVNPQVFGTDLNSNSFSSIKLSYLTKTSSVATVPTDKGIAPTGASLWYWANLGENNRPI